MGKITEWMIRKFKLEGEEGEKGETEVVRGASFTSGFDFNEIMRVRWLWFMQEIVSNENNFELLTLFDL